MIYYRGRKRWFARQAGKKPALSVRRANPYLAVIFRDCGNIKVLEKEGDKLLNVPADDEAEQDDGWQEKFAGHKPGDEQGNGKLDNQKQNRNVDQIPYDRVQFGEAERHGQYRQHQVKLV